MAQTRLVSGLVLMVFLASHLVNHALGIHSLTWMEAGRDVFDAVWRGLPGTIVLCAALIAHLAFVLWSLYRRDTLVMPTRDWVQLLLGARAIRIMLAAPPSAAPFLPGRTGDRCAARRNGLGDQPGLRHTPRVDLWRTGQMLDLPGPSRRGARPTGTSKR